MHYFKDKENTKHNAMTFEILCSDIPNFENFKKEFEYLHRAGLVVLSDTKVEFLCHWNKYIDRTMLERNDYKAGIVFKYASEYKEMIKNNHTLLNAIMSKNNISKTQLLPMLDLFCQEQDGVEKKYDQYSDCSKHFLNWVRTNMDKLPKESTVTVKSKSKILGME